MALVFKDRVQESTTTTGTGTLTLAGAIPGYQAFSAIGDGNITYYTIYDTNAGDWEVGIGTYTLSGTTLSRDTVLSSSNGGALVPFATGTKVVWCDYPSEKVVIQDENGSVQLGVSGSGTSLQTAYQQLSVYYPGFMSIATLNLSTDGGVWRQTSQLGNATSNLDSATGSYSWWNGNYSNLRMQLTGGGTLLLNTTTAGADGRLLVQDTGTYTIGAWNSTAVAANVGSSMLFSGGAAGNRLAAIGGYFSGAATTDGGYLTLSTRAVTTGTMTERVRVNASGYVGIGLTNDDTAVLQLAGGTTTAGALEFNNGTLMTTPDGGTMEFDGNNLSFTNDATSLRGYVPAVNIFRLTANGSAIGAAIANFFGANSAASVAAASTYELEAYCYFTKTTAGTIVVTLTSSQTPVNINGTVDLGAITGGTATGAANRISLFASASTAAAFGASGSLTTGVNHAFIIRAIIETNATNAGNIRINFTGTAGTVTPLRGSYYKLTKLPPGNSGNFVA